MITASRSEGDMSDITTTHAQGFAPIGIDSAAQAARCHRVFGREKPSGANRLASSKTEAPRNRQATADGLAIGAKSQMLAVGDMLRAPGCWRGCAQQYR